MSAATTNATKNDLAETLNDLHNDIAAVPKGTRRQRRPALTANVRRGLEHLAAAATDHTGKLTPANWPTVRTAANRREAEAAIRWALAVIALQQFRDGIRFAPPPPPPPGLFDAAPAPAEEAAK
jgi:hypothetical protein